MVSLFQKLEETMTNLKITNGHVVEFNYSLKNSEGILLDSSGDQGPMPYIHGKQNIVQGLEKEMTGKMVGDKFQVTVSPAEGYGIRLEELVRTFPKSDFEDPQSIQIGDRFQVQDNNGQIFTVTVIKLEDDQVVLDGNHPLAGVTLHFDIEIKSIKEATEQELSHGHIHQHGQSCGH